jgi:hypothetical protein
VHLNIKKNLIRLFFFLEKKLLLNNTQKKIYNGGERLIPGVTHDMLEVVRHKTSYDFFRAIIDDDIASHKKLSAQKKVTISDFGFGVGHGCYSLSRIRNCQITGVDISEDCKNYAEKHYSAQNIKYQAIDLAKYAKNMPEFDYVVSRGVLEHIPNGLNLAYSTKWKNRLIFDVPYNEKPDLNDHHILTELVEKDFSEFKQAEFFYQDLNGVIYDAKSKPKNPNMIICICSNPNMPPVKNKKLIFPFPIWRL